MLILWLLFATLFSRSYAKHQLETICQWKYMDYDWKSPQEREEAIKSGRYDHKSMIPIEADIYKPDPNCNDPNEYKVFVTVIGAKGVPSSLNIVSKKHGEGGPLLAPYPDWSWATSNDCSRKITSVYRIKIDECDRLWVLDSGVIEGNQVCPAQLLVFDLHTDQLIQQIIIPNDKSQNSRTKIGTLVALAVETYGPECSFVNVYMSDVVGYAMVIYKGETQSITRVESPVFDYDPTGTNFTVEGQSFTLEDGLLGLALGPGRIESRRLVAYKSLTSRDLYLTFTRDLLTAQSNVPFRNYRAKNIFPSQAIVMDFFENVLFYSLTNQPAIGCWNRWLPPRSSNTAIVAQDSERLQFVSGLKVLPKERVGTPLLCLFSNRIQKLYTNTVNYSDVNFRVLVGDADELMAGTVCDLSGNGSGGKSSPSDDDSSDGSGSGQSGSKENLIGSKENKSGSKESSIGSTENKSGSKESPIRSTENKSGSKESQSGSKENLIGSTENKSGSKESQSGSKENLIGSTENKSGSKESQSGSKENQIGSTENKSGSKESQGGSKENLIGSTENKSGSKDCQSESIENKSGSKEDKSGSKEDKSGSNQSENGSHGKKSHGKKHKRNTDSGSAYGSRESEEHLDNSSGSLGSSEDDTNDSKEYSDGKIGKSDSGDTASDGKYGSIAGSTGSKESLTGSKEGSTGSKEGSTGSKENIIGSKEGSTGSKEGSTGSKEDSTGSK